VRAWPRALGWATSAVGGFEGTQAPRIDPPDLAGGQGGIEKNQKWPIGPPRLRSTFLIFNHFLAKILRARRPAAAAATA
jgi:hypothetical protein